MRKIGPAAVPALIEALNDSRKPVSMRAHLALAEIGPAASDLIRVLGAEGDGERRVVELIRHDRGSAAAPADPDPARAEDDDPGAGAGNTAARRSAPNISGRITA